MGCTTKGTFVVLFVLTAHNIQYVKEFKFRIKKKLHLDECKQDSDDDMDGISTSKPQSRKHRPPTLTTPEHEAPTNDANTESASPRPA